MSRSRRRHPTWLLLAAAGAWLLVLAPLAADELRRPDPELFPVPTGFEANVAFWLDVFSRYSSHQVVLHDEQRLDLVYAVLDFTALEADPQLSEANKRKRRLQEVEAAENRFRVLLRELAAGHPARGEEGKRVEALLRTAGVERLDAGAPERLRTQTGLRDRFADALPRAARYMPAMADIFAARGLPTELNRIPFVESMFQDRARSKVGAAGVWQIMPANASRLLRVGYELDERHDPLRATEAAAAILADNHATLGNWPLAITAYNAGKNGLARTVEKLGTNDPAEVLKRNTSRTFGFASRNFYAEFLAAATVYENRERHFTGVPSVEPLRFEEFVPDRYVAIRDLARDAGTSVDELARLNPAYSSEVWQGDLLWPRQHALRVPTGRRQSFAEAYAALPETAKADQQSGLRYRVQRGDTLSTIARRFGTSPGAIQRANALKSAHVIREGQVLLITGSRRVATTGVSAGASPPASGVHVVRPGDTLWAIARLYRSCVEAIQRANGLSGSTALKIGQRLAIPTGPRC